MANTLKCGDCAYFYADWAKGHDGNEIAYCHWMAKCPGDIAPCEEEEPNGNLEGGAYGFEDEYEDEYDRNHCYPQEW